MTEIQIQENREDRYGKTERKNLTLTNEMVEAVQAYADRHGLYFSVAIETLALMGLGHTAAESFPRLVANLLERIFNRQFNRFAKLLSYTAISAQEANEKVDFLILQLFRREAQQNPDNFINAMGKIDVGQHVPVDQQHFVAGLPGHEIGSEVCRFLPHFIAVVSNDEIGKTVPIQLHVGVFDRSVGVGKLISLAQRIIADVRAWIVAR